MDELQQEGEAVWTVGNLIGGSVDVPVFETRG